MQTSEYLPSQYVGILSLTRQGNLYNTAICTCISFNTCFGQGWLHFALHYHSRRLYLSHLPLGQPVFRGQRCEDTKERWGQGDASESKTFYQGMDEDMKAPECEETSRGPWTLLTVAACATPSALPIRTMTGGTVFGQ